MKTRLGLCLLLLVGCKDSTAPDQDLTGNWAGTFATTAPPGPTEAWFATLTQAGTAITGSLNCASIETYTAGGTNVHNAIKLTLIGSFGDTAQLTGTASNNIGVLASGSFFDNDGAGCFSGAGTWQGRIQ
jgi:hypothetical protein